jgi:hypothetical protein
MTFLHNVHQFRGVAIICIVAAHALHNFNWYNSPFQFELINSIVNQSSVWFFFIAGYLFQHLSKNFDGYRYYKTKLRHVIIPYLIVSIPALIASLTIIDQNMPAGFSELSPFAQIALFLISGQHLAPFWFVPTIALLYMLAPVLVKLDRFKWPYVSLLLLIPLSLYLGRDGLLIQLGLNGYYGALSKAVYLFPAYYFGMFCSRYSEEIYSYTRRFQIPLIIVAALMLYATATNSYPTISFIFAFKLITALLLLYWLRHLTFPKQLYVDQTAELSFGIFFVHGYFLAATKIILPYLGVNGGIIGASIPLYILFTLLISALSITSLLIVKRITGAQSRMIIGC